MAIELEGLEVGGILWNARHKRQILKTARRLVREGSITRDMSQEDITDAITIALLEDEPATYGAIDWAKIIELIIQIMPLILALFG